MNEEKKASGKTGKIIAICAAAVILIAAITVIGISAKHSKVFLNNTFISGVDCSGLTPDGALGAIMDAATVTTVNIRDLRGYDVANIPLDRFLDWDALRKTVEDCFAAEHQEEGFFGWMHSERCAYVPDLCKELTDARVSTLLIEDIYNNGEIIPPQDAKIVLEDTFYVLQDAVTGNTVNVERCAAAVTEKLATLKTFTPGDIISVTVGDNPLVDVVVTNALELPRITEDSFAIQWQKEKLDEYLAHSVTIDFCNGNVYTLTAGDIYEVSSIKLTKAAATCRPVREKIAVLVDGLIEEYGSDGVNAKFGKVADTRELIYYRVGDNGWRLDRAALVEEIYQALYGTEAVTLKPVYDRTWYWKSVYHVGDTFVEISLDNQYMWYYVDGELLVETPVVTGNISNGDDTRRGCFEINYKVADVNLKGPTWDDHVDYWMPFDGEIGLHDSSWRSEYGGDIYLTEGSHGCVNTPLEAMMNIYNNIEAGVPVIVY